jgi:hypothetical protein
MADDRTDGTMQDLRVLVGEWEFTSPLFPEGRGRTTFEWLEAGLLLQRSRVSGPAPDSTWIFGGDDSEESLTVLYHDDRGVSRVYRSTLREGIWRVWRDAPGFSQRFSGRVSADGRTIEAAWESSADGARWKHDFDLSYTRVDGR